MAWAFLQSYIGFGELSRALVEHCPDLEALHIDERIPFSPWEDLVLRSYRALTPSFAEMEGLNDLALPVVALIAANLPPSVNERAGLKIPRTITALTIRGVYAVHWPSLFAFMRNIGSRVPDHFPLLKVVSIEAHGSCIKEANDSSDMDCKRSEMEKLFKDVGVEFRINDQWGRGLDLDEG